MAPCAPERGLALCDDFEAGDLDRERWTDVADDAVSLDSRFVRSGQKSLRVLGQNQKDGGGWLMTATPAALRSRMFGRAWVYLAGPAPHHHADFIKAEGPSPIGHAFYRFGFENQNLTANYFAFASPWREGAIPEDRFEEDAKPYAARENKWVCLEWYFEGPEQKTELWLDGERIGALAKGEADQQSWPAPIFEKTGIGFQIYQGQQEPHSFELWFDDVALDEERIGCD